MNERDNKETVVLRLVKTHEREVICDQYGRSLNDVVSFDYGVDQDDSAAYLTIRLRFPPPRWDDNLSLAIPPRQAGSGQ